MALSADAAGTTLIPELSRASSPRLWAYLTLVVAGLIAALASGRAELAVAVAPVALAALAGVVLAERPQLAAGLTLDADRVVEGTSVTGSVTLHCHPPRLRVDVLVPTTGPLSIESPAGDRLAWLSRQGTPERRLDFEATATRWGLGRAGPVWVRVYGPLGLVRWQGPLGTQTTVRVLPAAAALRTLLPHPDPRATSGAHLARRPGDGIEFANLRPYQPGDRLRSINWALSSRRGELWVNERRPERSAELVLLVDTFADDPSDGALALGRAARAAWLLAQAHLAAHDRVGLVTFGGYPGWVTPGSGDRGRYAFLDKLLATAAAWTEAQRSISVLPRLAVPPGASLVAVTPLHDLRMVSALLDLRQRGSAVAALQVDVTDLLPRPGETAGDAPARAAVRLWRLELERRAHVLDRGGVPVVSWPPGEAAATVLEMLRLASRAPALRGRGA